MTDEQILQKVDEAMKLGRKQALEEVRAEIAEQKKERCFDNMFEYITGLDDALYIIDKHRKKG